MSRRACLFVQFLLRMYAQARNQCRDMVFLIRDIFAKGQYLAKGPVSELPSDCITKAFLTIFVWKALQKCIGRVLHKSVLYCTGSDVVLL